MTGNDRATNFGQFRGRRRGRNDQDVSFIWMVSQVQDERFDSRPHLTNGIFAGAGNCLVQRASDLLSDDFKSGAPGPGGNPKRRRNFALGWSLEAVPVRQASVRQWPRVSPLKSAGRKCSQ